MLSENRNQVKLANLVMSFMILEKFVLCSNGGYYYDVQKNAMHRIYIVKKKTNLCACAIWNYRMVSEFWGSLKQLHDGRTTGTYFFSFRQTCMNACYVYTVCTNHAYIFRLSNTWESLTVATASVHYTGASFVVLVVAFFVRRWK